MALNYNAGGLPWPWSWLRLMLCPPAFKDTTAGATCMPCDLASLWSVLFVLPSPCVSPQNQTNLDYLLAGSANPCGLQQAWPWWCNKPAAHSCACRKAPAFDVVLQTPAAQQQRTPSYGRPRSRPATRARRPCGSYCLAALNIAAAQTPSRQQQARRGPCTRPSP
jgi:hypothetical protein